MRIKNQSRRARAGRMAAMACAGALALSGCDFDVYSLPLPGGADLGDEQYSVKVEFRDVLDLVPQSSVKVNDVTVGKVTDIDVDGYQAEVTLALRGDVDLPDNALAEIRQTSLLGEKFVSLEPPAGGASAEKLENGDVIPLDRSGRNPEVEEVLGAMS
ncbi:MAG: MlaD family protein, partial [Nocardioidaceae bacterium]